MKHLATPGSTPAGVTLNGCRESWLLAEEVPVGILVNSRPVAVMMASPADLEELAIGFLLAEGKLARAEVRTALVLPTEQGFCVDVAADRDLDSPERALEGRSGCGLCGMAALTDVQLSVPHRSRAPLDPQAVAAAFDDLARHQPMREANRSVHAAGFANVTGRILLAREDVGRHCALDKLVGALAVREMDPAGGFAVLTSRCSFELVQKAALAGLAGLATRSAPTGLALEVGRAAGLPLACRAPGGIALF